MSATPSFFNELDSILLKDVEKLAGGNMSPSDIALKLDINKASFMRLWRDKESTIREAYERGRLAIEAMKAKKLEKAIKKGNLTARQIHDNQAAEKSFEDLKSEVFGFE